MVRKLREDRLYYPGDAGTLGAGRCKQLDDARGAVDLDAIGEGRRCGSWRCELPKGWRRCSHLRGRVRGKRHRGYTRRGGARRRDRRWGRDWGGRACRKGYGLYHESAEAGGHRWRWRSHVRVTSKVALRSDRGLRSRLGRWCGECRGRRGPHVGSRGFAPTEDATQESHLGPSARASGQAQQCPSTASIATDLERIEFGTTSK